MVGIVLAIMIDRITFSLGGLQILLGITAFRKSLKVCTRYTQWCLKTYARKLQFILAWNIHNILYGLLTDKMWNFDVIPRPLIRFGNLNNDGHNSLITSYTLKNKGNKHFCIGGIAYVFITIFILEIIFLQGD